MKKFFLCFLLFKCVFLTAQVTNVFDTTYPVVVNRIGCNPVRILFDGKYTASTTPCGYYFSFPPQYGWDFGDGINQAGFGIQDTISHNYISAGTYTVTYSTEGDCPFYHCKTFGQIVITVPPILTMQIDHDSVPCYNSRVLLIANGATNYTWYGITSGDTIKNDTAIIHPKITTFYQVGVSGSSCYTASKKIVVIPLETKVSPNIISCLNKAVIVATGAPAYNWSGLLPGDTILSNTDTIIVHPTKTMTYSTTSSNLACPIVETKISLIDCPGRDYSLPFPNPSSGSVTVYLSDDIEEIQVTNTLGQLIQSFVPNTSPYVTFEFEESGVYFINFISFSGTMIKKVIVSKHL